MLFEIILSVDEQAPCMSSLLLFCSVSKGKRMHFKFWKENEVHDPCIQGLMYFKRSVTSHISLDMSELNE